VDIIGEVVGNPGKALTDYHFFWAVPIIILCAENCKREDANCSKLGPHLFGRIGSCKKSRDLNHEGFTNCENYYQDFNQWEMPTSLL
jgi:hypothetical protein